MAENATVIIFIMIPLNSGFTNKATREKRSVFPHCIVSGPCRLVKRPALFTMAPRRTLWILRKIMLFTVNKVDFANGSEMPADDVIHFGNEVPYSLWGGVQPDPRARGIPCPAPNLEAR